MSRSQWHGRRTGACSGWPPATPVSYPHRQGTSTGPKYAFIRCIREAGQRCERRAMRRLSRPLLWAHAGLSHGMLTARLAGRNAWPSERGSGPDRARHALAPDFHAAGAPARTSWSLDAGKYLVKHRRPPDDPNIHLRAQPTGVDAHKSIRHARTNRDRCRA